MHISTLPVLAEGFSIGDLDSLSETRGLIIEKKIKTIYLAQHSNIAPVKIQFSDLEVLPFEGGFKTGSILLFSLKTAEEIKYFNKITGYSITKCGDLILAS